jgi:hypothetical protein
MLYFFYRQSKLSQDQLAELQKSTHFDKKELQQWYKGAPPTFGLDRIQKKADTLILPPRRFPKRLPIGNA